MFANVQIEVYKSRNILANDYLFCSMASVKFTLQCLCGLNDNLIKSIICDLVLRRYSNLLKRIPTLLIQNDKISTFPLFLV